jgi:hypothetical protein
MSGQTIIIILLRPSYRIPKDRRGNSKLEDNIQLLLQVMIICSRIVSISLEIEKVISEQGGVEGQRKEVNVESYSKTASLGQILKDLDFPAGKDKIIQFVQQKNPDASVLPSLRKIEDKQYQNVSDVTKAAGLVY